MAKWRKTVKIKHLLSTDQMVGGVSDEHAQAVGAEISEILKASGWSTLGLDNLIEELSDVDDVHHLNYLLDLMYDYADESRVWIS